LWFQNKPCLSVSIPKSKLRERLSVRTTSHLPTPASLACKGSHHTRLLVYSHDALHVNGHTQSYFPDRRGYLSDHQLRVRNTENHKGWGELMRQHLHQLLAQSLQLATALVSAGTSIQQKPHQPASHCLNETLVSCRSIWLTTKPAW
jgi:hypothetical protein